MQSKKEYFTEVLQFFNGLECGVEFKQILSLVPFQASDLEGWKGLVTILIETENKSPWEIDVRYAFGPMCFKQALIEESLSKKVHSKKQMNSNEVQHKAILYLCGSNLEIPFAGWSFVPAPFLVSQQWKSISHCFIPLHSRHPFDSHVCHTQEEYGNRNFTLMRKFNQGKNAIKTEIHSSRFLLKTTDCRREGGQRTRGWDKQESSEYPLVSVVTIVFNGEEFLEQTIQSVINQTYKNVEYIIVDGGSVDGTLEIIKRYDELIDYWVSEPDGGLYNALNKGIELASGSIIGMIHSNDLYTPTTVSDVVTQFREDSKVEFCYGNLNLVWPDYTKTVGRRIKSTFRMVLKSEFNHPTCFLKRDLYEKFGGFDTTFRIAADYDLGVRLWKAGVCFCYLNRTLAYFRMGGTSSELFKNQWERHKVRIKNEENTLWSFTIYLLVLLIFFLKNKVPLLK
jgi:GT2 family glycosyltransferase